MNRNTYFTLRATGPAGFFDSAMQELPVSIETELDGNDLLLTAENGAEGDTEGNLVVKIWDALPEDVQRLLLSDECECHWKISVWWSDGAVGGIIPFSRRAIELFALLKSTLDIHVYLLG